MSIHPTAVVHKDARIDAAATVGPFAIIGGNVEIGPRCAIGPHVWLDHARIGEGTRIGASSLIGGDPQMLNWKEVPSLVRIGANNDIHELVTMHRSKDENGVTVVGNDCMIMTNTHIGHDCAIGDNVIITTYAGLSGSVTVNNHVIIGGQVGIHQFVRIGEYAMIGGMARIVQDVVPYMLAEGSPAHIRNFNVVGLKRKGFSEAARAEIKQAFKILFAGRGNLKTAKEGLAALPDESGYIKKIIAFIGDSKRGITTGKNSREEPEA
ncbi:MAG: acyl-ACP--UDP-N-acetylglucosamine O-acyltransferase [Nitrospinae bacterium]|nr:acyl-ACP--UDP-N-acetylglucosamine O-acyltransferase [Nitrospinota bacterium]